MAIAIFNRPTLWSWWTSVVRESRCRENERPTYVPNRRPLAGCPGGLGMIAVRTSTWAVGAVRALRPEQLLPRSLRLTAVSGTVLEPYRNRITCLAHHPPSFYRTRTGPTWADVTAWARPPDEARRPSRTDNRRGPGTVVR